MKLFLSYDLCSSIHGLVGQVRPDLRMYYTQLFNVGRITSLHAAEMSDHLQVDGLNPAGFMRQTELPHPGYVILCGALSLPHLGKYIHTGDAYPQFTSFVTTDSNLPETPFELPIGHRAYEL